jgi:NAD(P)H-dependent FMN reductase
MRTAPNHPEKILVLADNTVDWVTRVGSSAFAHLRFLVASASPGRSGGANGVAMVRTCLSSMGIDTAERTLSVSEASVGTNGELLGLDHAESTRFAREAIPQPSAA